MPGQIGRPKLPGSQSFADLLECEFTELRPVARHMDHRHNSLYEAREVKSISCSRALLAAVSIEVAFAQAKPDGEAISRASHSEAATEDAPYPKRLFVLAFAGPSSARQKYHAATERYGRHLSPIFWNCFGVGNFFRPNVFAKPFWTP